MTSLNARSYPLNATGAKKSKVELLMAIIGESNFIKAPVRAVKYFNGSLIWGNISEYIDGKFKKFYRWRKSHTHE